MVENSQGERTLRTFGEGGKLCLPSSGNGTVAVFENEDALEGCTRIAEPGMANMLVSYASFDNCDWR